MARKNEEYAGRWVRLRRAIDTRGGSHFPKGGICKVTYVERGKLNIRMRNPDPLNIFGPRYLFCSNVERWDVEFLSSKADEPPREELADGAMDDGDDSE